MRRFEVGAVDATILNASVMPLPPLLMLPLAQELGIPTANVDADSLRHSIAEAVTGIYCGWASIGDSSEVRV
jgi:hypothetical protein